MWLFAGITLLFLNINISNFGNKYSNQLKLFFKVIVTKLLQRSQSAGYFILNSNESTSETLRNKSVVNIKKISIHVPIHLKPTKIKPI
jgi:hypothetical protein